MNDSEWMIRMIMNDMYWMIMRSMDLLITILKNIITKCLIGGEQPLTMY